MENTKHLGCNHSITIMEEKRCIIGEGPIWNSAEERLYFTNGFGNEICTYDFKTDRICVRPLPFGVSAFAFDKENRLIVSHENGVFILNEDDSLTPIYDNSKYQIKHANDMKVGPDGAIYVGTQSSRRIGISNELDGKLYRISPTAEVSILLDGLILSNGMDWSIDESKFYHTDSDTHVIKEYSFDKLTGKISFTGRELYVKGVDGFTIGYDNYLYVSCWGEGHVAVICTDTMELVEHIVLPCNIPASCGFCGPDMDILAITTACYNTDIATDTNAGFLLLRKSSTKGRKPYLFG